MHIHTTNCIATGVYSHGIITECTQNYAVPLKLEAETRKWEFEQALSCRIFCYISLVSCTFRILFFRVLKFAPASIGWPFVQNWKGDIDIIVGKMLGVRLSPTLPTSV